MAADAPPTFFLYGEAPRAAGAGFLHLEPLDARSRPSGWSIREHRHADLHHVFLMTAGGGEILAGGRRTALAAPCLLFVPAGTVHGFAFERESVGHVLTIAGDFIDSRPACAEASVELFRHPLAVPCGAVLEPLRAAFSELGQELGWLAPGHSAAVESLILRAFVLALRLRPQAMAGEEGGVGRDVALIARFREQIELRFRRHAPLEAYADALQVSVSRLHRACSAVAGSTPLAMIQARRLVEAKRALLYSDLSIAEVAANLGFQDPAYFSRFFARQAGLSARAFRRTRAEVA